MPTALNGGGSARSGHLGQAHINSQYVLRLKQWSVSCTASESTWGDSDALGYTNRKLARKDATGSLTGVQHDLGNGNNNDIYYLVSSSTVAQTPLAGRRTRIELFENGTAGRSWLFPLALIQNFNITYDMDTMEVVEWTMDFGADGIFFRPGEALCGGRERGTYDTVTC